LPSSRFLTVEEARKLALLEAQLDKLKIACRIVELHEDLAQIDKGLLHKMRARKPRGTTLYPIGAAPETATWCSPCGRYSDPRRYWTLPTALARNACEYCDAHLPNIDELSSQLLSKSNEKQKQAAKTLAKTYRYNKSELKHDNVKRLIKALILPLAEVREDAATALMHIGKRLENVKAEQHGYVDFRDDALNALIELLSRRETEASVRKAAVRAIGCISHGTHHVDKAKKQLEQALEDDDPEIVKQAVWATGVIGDCQLLPLLQGIMTIMTRMLSIQNGFMWGYRRIFT
jgi:hypothetical protein